MALGWGQLGGEEDSMLTAQRLSLLVGFVHNGEGQKDGAGAAGPSMKATASGWLVVLNGMMCADGEDEGTGLTDLENWAGSLRESVLQL